jgi:hypothetical protein
MQAAQQRRLTIIFNQIKRYIVSSSAHLVAAPTTANEDAEKSERSSLLQRQQILNMLPPSEEFRYN